jgi:hypothetical protein
MKLKSIDAVTYEIPRFKQPSLGDWNRSLVPIPKRLRETLYKEGFDIAFTPNADDHSPPRIYANFAFEVGYIDSDGGLHIVRSNPQARKLERIVKKYR